MSGFTKHLYDQFSLSHKIMKIITMWRCCFIHLVSWAQSAALCPVAGNLGTPNVWTRPWWQGLATKDLHPLKSLISADVGDVLVLWSMVDHSHTHINTHYGHHQGTNICEWKRTCKTKGSIILPSHLCCRLAWKEVYVLQYILSLVKKKYFSCIRKPICGYLHARITWTFKREIEAKHFNDSHLISQK